MPSIVASAGLVAVLASLPLTSHVVAQASPPPADGFVGFFERCSRQRIVCFSVEDLSSRRNYRLSEILSRAVGISRRCQSSMSGCLLYMRASAGLEECAPTYFVNGVTFFKSLPDQALAELDRLVSTSDVLGIEVYRSEQRPPAPFDLQSRCGVILIWKR